jgi:hypothetical protein
MSTASALVAETDERVAQPAEGRRAGPLDIADPPTAQARVYRGRSIDELIPQIEAELGADAIVVRRRRGLEGGIGGFFQRPYVEVEAKPGTPRLDVYDELSGAPALPTALQAPAEREQISTPAPGMRRPLGAYVTDTLATIAAAGTPAPEVQDPPPAASSPAEFRELTPDTFGAALAEAARAAEQALPAPAPLPATTSVSMPPAASAPEEPFEAELERIDRGMSTQAVVASPPRRERARAAIEGSMAARSWHVS